MFPEALVCESGTGEPDDLESRWETVLAMQVEEGGNELALREISRGAEYHYRRRKRAGIGCAHGLTPSTPQA